MNIFSCYRYLRYLDDQLNKMKSSSLKQFNGYSKSILYFIYKFIKLNSQDSGLHVHCTFSLQLRHIERTDNTSNSKCMLTCTENLD